MTLLRPTALATAIVVTLLTPLAATAPADGAARGAPRSQDSLSGVSCPRPSFCMAVGQRADGAHGALAELWNGKRWRVLATPTVTGPHGGSNLFNVSCVSAARCLALGQKNTASSSLSVSFVEVWNGLRWRVMDLRVPRDAQLAGISCGRRTCMIVGEYLTSAGSYPLAMQLRGTRLRLLKPRVPRGRQPG